MTNVRDDRHHRTELVAKPRDELHNNPKSIADCTELHLARRGITTLPDDMVAFESLEVLWLNDNCLSRIAGLDYNTTIKSLYAHNNSLHTLQGSLQAFTFLHTLTLGDNCLSNLQTSLAILKLMRHLRYLDLSGNPLAEETGYRLLVIKHLPWLHTLDMHAVDQITSDERASACCTRVPKSWTVLARGRAGDSVGFTQELAARETERDSWQGRRGSISVPCPLQRPGAKRTEAMLQKEVSRMRDVVKKRRILLKTWFEDKDPRREEVVSQELFMRCLSQHGLWPPGLPSAANSTNGAEPDRSMLGASTMSGEWGLLAGVILEAFRVARPPTRAVSLGRDPPVLQQTFVDYVTFCGAVEPKFGGRDLDNRARELDKAWKIRTPPPSRGDPVASRGAGPAPVPRREHRWGPSEGRRAARLGSNEGDDDSTGSIPVPARAPMACDRAASGSLDDRGCLDHWERLEFRRALEEQAAKNPPAKDFVTKPQALAALDAMESRGRRPRILVLDPPASFDEDSFHQLSTGTGGPGSSTPSAEPESHRTNFDAIFDAAAANPSITDGAGAAPGGPTRARISELMQAMRAGVAGEGVTPLEWEWISRRQAAEQSSKLFREAAHAQRRMSLMLDSEDAKVQEHARQIRDEIAELVRNATFLETHAAFSSVQAHTLPPHWSAGRGVVCAAAGGRKPSRSFGVPRGTGEHRSPICGAVAECLLPRSVGRVDVFLASDFQGGPFRDDARGSAEELCPGNGVGGTVRGAAVAASANPYAGDVSISTGASLAGASLTSTGVCGSGDGMVGETRPRESRAAALPGGGARCTKRIMTAGG